MSLFKTEPVNVGLPTGLGEDVELEPDAGQIVQAEEDAQEEIRAAPVCVTEVKDIVRVQMLPSKASRIRTVRIAANSAAQLLPPDPRRRLCMISASGSFYIANRGPNVLDDMTRFLLPVGAALPPVTLYATDELWGGGAGSEVAVYIYTEQWAN